MRQIHDTKFVFVHIPKTGGQAITQALSLKHLPTDHLFSREEDKHLLEPQFVRFCVVRNPIDRFISAYKYHVFMTEKNPNKEIRRTMLQYGLTEDINDFLDHVQESGAPLLDDLHFRRQIWFIRKSAPKIILRFENLETDFEIMQTLVPQHAKPLARKNSSRDRDGPAPASTIPSPANLKYLKTHYARDLDFLGYKA